MRTSRQPRATRHGHDERLQEERDQLERLDAQDVQLALDDQFEPEAGILLRVEVGLAFWHLPPGEFHRLIRDLPDGAGSEAIKQTIEADAMHVWHGPSPPRSRDSTP
jgi:hypothetical protein